jgi:hypothetical protein
MHRFAASTMQLFTASIMQLSKSSIMQQFTESIMQLFTASIMQLFKSGTTQLFIAGIVPCTVTLRIRLYTGDFGNLQRNVKNLYSNTILTKFYMFFHEQVWDGVEKDYLYFHPDPKRKG